MAQDDGHRLLPYGPFSYEVCNNFGFFDPHPHCHCLTHATYQYYYLLMGYPLPRNPLLTSYMNGPFVRRWYAGRSRRSCSSARGTARPRARGSPGFRTSRWRSAPPTWGPFKYDIRSFGSRWRRGVPQKQTIVLISCVSVTVTRGRRSKNENFADVRCEWSLVEHRCTTFCLHVTVRCVFWAIHFQLEPVMARLITTGGR